MSDLEFYQTRAGRTYYEHTLPELIRQMELLNERLEKLVERTRGVCGEKKGSCKKEHP